MVSKLFGGITLIIGTCIGASMLALPTTTAQGGFSNAIILMIIAWGVMTYSSLVLTEVNDAMPSQANLISMAHLTLGKYGAALTWLVYLALLYTLLSAYIAGGSELLVNLLGLAHLNVTPNTGAILFTFFFGAIVYQGIGLVDWINRGLMSGKLIAFLLLCSLLLPYTDIHKLPSFPFKEAYSGLMMIFTAFGYAIIIPSIRDYFQGDVKKLRLAVLIGSLIPLTCYVLWIFVIQSTITSVGPQGLISINQSGEPLSMLVNVLSQQLHSASIGFFVHFFTSICILTAFLSVGLSLSDFLADGLKREKIGVNKLLIIGLTCGPPLAVVLLNPRIFVSSLSYAGVLCIILLTLVPALMVYSKRYVKKIPSRYEVVGGKFLIVIIALIATTLIIIGMAQMR